MEELKKELVAFFIEAKKYQPLFKRKTYEEGFKECYASYSNLIDRAIQACETSENREAAVEALAGAIPEYVHGKLLELPKRSREREMVDYNLLLVTFVIPTIVYKKEEIRNAFADKIIELWNRTPVTLKIQKSDFETLNGSFKTRPCYITTAVCEMQDKTDNCYELEMLRSYRDEYLIFQPEGEQVVREYYDIAPTIVNRINKSGKAKEIYGNIYETYIIPCLSLIEEGKPEECQSVYVEMVRTLQKEYLH